MPTWNDIRRSPVVSGLAFLSVASTLAWWWSGWNVAVLAMDSSAFGRQPWRLVTSGFLHIDAMHLAFNVYWLWIFGRAIEGVLGPWRTTLLFIGLLAGSSAADWALDTGGVGLSGLGYGLFAFLWAVTPRDRRFPVVVTAREIRLFVGWFFLCVVLTYLKVWRVANTAHASGALLGALFGMAVATQGGIRQAWSIALCSTFVVFGLGATTFRTRVNFNPAHAHGDRAYQLLEDHNPQAAIVEYEAALALDDSVANYWDNLGVGYHQTGQLEQALRCYRRALSLERDDEFALEGERDVLALLAPQTNEPIDADLERCLVEPTQENTLLWNALQAWSEQSQESYEASHPNEQWCMASWWRIS